MIKIVAVIVVLFLIYKILFKKSNKNDIDSKDNETQAEVMLDCFFCDTLVAQNEAILHNGAYFCSQECIEQRNKDAFNR